MSLSKEKYELLIAKRMAVMYMLYERFLIEINYQRSQGLITSESIEILEKLKTHAVNCVDEFDSVFPHHEFILLTSDLGAWSTEIFSETSWNLESYRCLLWALNPSAPLLSFEEISPYSSLEAQLNVNNILFLARQEGHNKLFQLRKDEEIVLASKQAEMLYKRCLFSKSLVENPKKKLPLDPYSTLFEFEKYNMPVSSNGDLIVAGFEFCDLSRSAETIIESLAACRVKTFAWLECPLVSWHDVSISHLTTI